MCVVPLIIVLVITALVVFRRELTGSPAAPASKPTPSAKQCPLRQLTGDQEVAPCRSPPIQGATYQPHTSYLLNI
jgi:hypothetical protein